MALIEIAADTLASAFAAQDGGAQRVELCSALREGGLTPSLGLLRAVRAQLRIELCVLLRPRPGDFLYSPEDFKVLREDLKIAAGEGADGVVFWVLKADGAVVEARTQALVALACPLKTSFHRAIDMTRDPSRALESVIRCGADRVLTSGGAPSAIEGSVRLRAMVQAAGEQITVVVGGGVRPGNVAELAWRTGATEFHSSMSHTQASPMQFRVPHLSLGAPGADEYRHTVVRAQDVRTLVQAAEARV